MENILFVTQMQSLDQVHMCIRKEEMRLFKACVGFCVCVCVVCSNVYELF